MVGVHVILDIVPQRIDPAAWADAFEETLLLLRAHPARLLGYGFRLVAGVRVPVFTRSVEQGGQDPAERRWCVVGDRATLGTGERQRMYRDLGRYLARFPVVQDAVRPINDGDEDILRWIGVSAREGAPATVRVFGEGDQSEPCRLGLLAAAMVVETRFPRHAVVSGSFDRQHAETARRWAKGVLERSITLPVRVDAWRLVERLGARLTGEALVREVDRLYLAPPGPREAALLGVFGRTEAEPWLAGKLREHASPDEAGALHAVAAYLEHTRDLARLAGLACLDARGPRWPPEAFVAALAALGKAHGFQARPRVDPAALDHALRAVFGEAAPRLEATFRAALRSPVPASGALDEAAHEPPSIDALTAAGSPGELDPARRQMIHRLAHTVRDLRHRVEDHRGPASVGAARRTVASLLARAGPTLTEDAWEWIDREDDPDLCAFLATLAAVEPADAEATAVRRVLLENRALCRYAAGVSRDR